MSQSNTNGAAGFFLVLEGSDGSGKATQLQLLTERLKMDGYEVEVFDFPRYDQPSSHFVKRYLNGDYGAAVVVNPYSTALFFALDRFEAAPAIRQALADGKIVLANRYVGSNMAHQGAKFGNPAEQRGFFIWADSLEYNLLGIPRPDLNILLRIPAELSFKLIGHKNARSYTAKSHDEHEADIEYLRRSAATYDLLHQLFPKDFMAIDCANDNHLLDINAISDRVWQTVQPLLPPPPTPKTGQKAKAQNHSSTRVPKPASPKIAKNKTDSASGLLLEDISLLLAGSLEGVAGVKSRINDSWSEAKANHRYYDLTLPAELDQPYREVMDKLISLHKEVQHELKLADYKALPLDSRAEVSNILKALTPMAAICKMRLEANRASLATTVDDLFASRLDEAKSVAQKIIDDYPLKDVSPPKTKGSSSVNQNPVSIKQTIYQLVQNRLPKLSSTATEPLQLLNFWPRNEFEILIDGIYPHTNLSRAEIISEIDQWDYNQKVKALKTVIAQADGRLDSLRYHWDVICDRLTLRELINQDVLKDLHYQPPTIRYGYAVPKIVEELRLEEPFLQCFDLSLELFSAFQAAEREDLAGYAVLQGHKTRVQFTTGVNLLTENLAAEGYEDYQNLLKAMQDQIKQVHPLIASNLSKPALGKDTDSQSAPKQTSRALGRRRKTR